MEQAGRSVGAQLAAVGEATKLAAYCSMDSLVMVVSDVETDWPRQDPEIGRDQPI